MRGYTETLFGRRRPIPELSNSNFRIRQAGERQAMNAGHPGSRRRHLQGRARAHRRALLEAAFAASGSVLQVHDEVIVEAPESTRRTSSARSFVDIMRDAVKLDVPMEVYDRLLGLVHGRTSSKS